MYNSPNNRVKQSCEHLGELLRIPTVFPSVRYYYGSMYSSNYYSSYLIYEYMQNMFSTRDATRARRRTRADTNEIILFSPSLCARTRTI